jgi:hypothetical protein
MDNKMDNEIEIDTKIEVVKDEVVNEEVKRRGRPRKYATEEESKAMQLKQIMESYDRRNKDREIGKVGRKATNITVDEIRERQRLTQRRYLERKKLKVHSNENNNENI